MQWRKQLKMRLQPCNIRMRITLRLMKPLSRRMPWTRMSIRTSPVWKLLLTLLCVVRTLPSRVKWMQWRKQSRMRLQPCNIRMLITIRLTKPLLRQMPWTRMTTKISPVWKLLLTLLCVARTLPSRVKWMQWRKQLKMRLQLYNIRMRTIQRWMKPLLRRMPWIRMTTKTSLVWKLLSTLLCVARTLPSNPK